MGGLGIRILKNLPPMGGQGTEWVKSTKNNVLCCQIIENIQSVSGIELTFPLTL
jgi:hypothetical protein